MNNVSEIDIAIQGQVHKAILGVPDNASGMVIFAHGSGSSRLSRRNNFVAEVIREHGIATLLFDLLTLEEDRVYANRFDIPVLTDRLVEVTNWILGISFGTPRVVTHLTPVALRLDTNYVADVLLLMLVLLMLLFF